MRPRLQATTYYLIGERLRRQKNRSRVAVRGGRIFPLKSLVRVHPRKFAQSSCVVGIARPKGSRRAAGYKLQWPNACSTSFRQSFLLDGRKEKFIFWSLLGCSLLLILGNLYVNFLTIKEAYSSPGTIVSTEFLTEYQEFGTLLCMRKMGFARECPNPDLPFASPDGNVYIGASRQMIRLNTTRTEINVFDDIPTIEMEKSFPGTLGYLLKTCWKLDPFSSTKGARYELSKDYNKALLTPEVLQFNLGWINGSSRFQRNSPCTRMYLIAYSNGVDDIESRMNDEANTAVPVDVWNTLVQSQPKVKKTIKLDGTVTHRIQLETMAVSSLQVNDEVLGNGEVRQRYKKDMKFSLMMFSPSGFDWQVETLTERLTYTWMDFLSSFFAFLTIITGIIGWFFPRDPYTGRVFFQFGFRNETLKTHFTQAVPMLNKDWDQSEFIAQPQGNVVQGGVQSICSVQRVNTRSGVRGVRSRTSWTPRVSEAGLLSRSQGVDEKESELPDCHQNSVLANRALLLSEALPQPSLVKSSCYCACPLESVTSGRLDCVEPHVRSTALPKGSGWLALDRAVRAQGVKCELEWLLLPQYTLEQFLASVHLLRMMHKHIIEAACINYEAMFRWLRFGCKIAYKPTRSAYI
eukprot:jgi/Bigna1/73047/fgenesh1_pg.22_\